MPAGANPLANTSAGIHSFSTMELRLRIKAMPLLDHKTASGAPFNAEEDDNAKAIEELQLVIEDDEPHLMESVVPGKAYGRRQ